MSLNLDTQLMISQLPKWMRDEWNKDDSVGGNILQVFSKQCQSYEALVENILLSHFPQVDLSKEQASIFDIDYIYKAFLGDIIFEKITVIDNNSTVDLEVASSLHEFYSRRHNAFYDAAHQYLYIKDRYAKVIINGQLEVAIIPHHVWGPYDELGLMLGCTRQHLETNEHYKQRLLSVYRSPANATAAGLRNFLLRELSMEHSPITLHEINVQDLDNWFLSQYENESDIDEYLRASNIVNASDGNQYWDVIQDNLLGLSYLPIKWNIELEDYLQEEIQNGVGDTEDLLIIAPEINIDAQTFTLNLYDEYPVVEDEQYFPEHSLQLEVVAEAVVPLTEADRNNGEHGYSPQDYIYQVAAAEQHELNVTVNENSTFIEDNIVHMNPAANTGLCSRTISNFEEEDINITYNNITAVDGNVATNPTSIKLHLFRDDNVNLNPDGTYAGTPRITGIRLIDSDDNQHDFTINQLREYIEDMRQTNITMVANDNHQIVLSMGEYNQKFEFDNNTPSNQMSGLKVDGNKLKISL